MLPEQRGLLGSWFSRLRRRGRQGRFKNGEVRRRISGYARSISMEPLEERALLTTLYVDFGTRLGNFTQTEALWATYGLVPPNNQASWIQGPQFNIAGNPQIAYTTFANVMGTAANAAIVNNFDPGTAAATDPFQYNAGASPPFDKISAIETSIIEQLTRQFAPFNISVVQSAARNMGDVQAALYNNNRVDDPYLIPAHAALNPPPVPDPFYGPLGANGGHQPPGFDPASMLTANGIAFGAFGSSEDVYVFVGGWTLPADNDAQVAAVQGNKLGFSNNLADPNDVSGAYPTFTDPNDLNMAVGGKPITYADNGAAVAADTTAQILLALDPGLTGTAPFRFNTAIATLIAQEAMIDYGLQHTSTGEATVGNPFFDPDVDLLSGSDVMRDGPQEAGNPFPSLANVAYFTNMPLMLGDFNQNPTVTQNAYNTLIGVDPLANGTDLTDIIGPNPVGVAYVTGTGAYDHISITDAGGGMADVTIDSYRTAAMAPGDLIQTPASPANDTFSYQIDLTTVTQLLIELGNNNDQIDIDPTIAALAGLSIQIFGGGGTNNFSMADNGSDSVAIAATNLNSFSFAGIERFDTQLNLSSGVLFDLQEFQDNSIVHMEGFKALSYAMPQFLGDNFTLTARSGSGLVFPPTPGGTDMTIDGTAGPTALSPVIGVCNVEFTNVGSVTITNLIGFTADQVTVDTTAGFSDGLQNLEVDLGPGADTLNVIGTNLTLPVAGGAFTYNGGTDVAHSKDTIAMTGDVNWTLSDTEVDSSAGGSVMLVSVENAILTGGASANTFNITGAWSGSATLNGLAGDDTFNIGAVGTPVTGIMNISGGDGNDTINAIAWSGSGTLNGDNDNDTYNIGTAANPISATFTADGGAGNDTFNILGWTNTGPNNSILGSAGNDTVNIGAVGAPIAAVFSVDGGDNNDIINVNAWTGGGTLGGGNGNDTFNVGTVGNPIAAAFPIDGGAGDDTFNIIAWTGGGALTGDAGNDKFNIESATATIAIPLTVSGGDDSDTFNILGWSAPSGSLSGNAGNDTFNIGTASKAITGSFSMDGGNDTDVFNVTNWTGGGNITDPAGTNVYNITHWTGNGNITGGTGNDTINVNGWSGNGNIGGGTAGTDAFNINSWTGNGNMTGGSGTDTFNILGWTGTGAVTGGTGNDTFNVGDATHNVTANFSINGVAGTNTYNLNHWSGTGDLNGGSGNDTFNIGMASDIDTVTAHHALFGNDGVDLLNLDDGATSEGENYDVTATSVFADPATPHPFGGIDFDSSLENLTLTGTKGNNSFSVTPNFFTAIKINGNLQTTADSLVVDFTGTAGATLTKNGATNGTWSFTSGQLPITFTSIEQLQVLGTAVGGGGGSSSTPSIAFLADGADAANTGKPLVKVYDAASNNLLFSFYAYETTFHGGVRVSAADVTGDGIPDIIVAPGIGRIGEVKVYDGAQLFAAAPISGQHLITNPDQFLIGGTAVNLTTTKNSKTAKVASTLGLAVGQSVIGANIPAGATIAAINNGTTITLSVAATATAANTSTNIAGILPEGSAYKSGLNIATGDLNDDGIADIVTSSTTGLGHVREYLSDVGPSFTPSLSFMAYTSKDKVTTGAKVAVGDIDGDGFGEVVTAPGAGTASLIKVFNSQSASLVRSFTAFEPTFKNGVSLAVGDLDGDGLAEIVVGAGTSGSSRVRVYDSFGTVREEFKAYTTGSIQAPVKIALHEVNGLMELFTSQSNNGSSRQIRGFNPLTGAQVDAFLETDPSFIGGISLG